VRDEAISPPSSTRHCGLRRLHRGFDDVGTDLLSHLATSDSGEAVVKTRANPGVGNLIAESPKVGKVMRDPG
jgi:hypothetical protein